MILFKYLVTQTDEAQILHTVNLAEFFHHPLVHRLVNRQYHDCFATLLAAPDFHVGDVDAIAAQGRTDATNHTGTVNVAADQHVPGRLHVHHQAVKADDTRLAVDDRTVEDAQAERL